MNYCLIRSLIVWFTLAGSVPGLAHETCDLWCGTDRSQCRHRPTDRTPRACVWKTGGSRSTRRDPMQTRRGHVNSKQKAPGPERNQAHRTTAPPCAAACQVFSTLCLFTALHYTSSHCVVTKQVYKGLKDYIHPRRRCQKWASRTGFRLIWLYNNTAVCHSFTSAASLKGY